MVPLDSANLLSSDPRIHDPSSPIRAGMRPPDALSLDQERLGFGHPARLLQQAGVEGKGDRPIRVLPP
jgi:hypothetical protein